MPCMFANVCEGIHICFGLPRDFCVFVFVYTPLAVCCPPPHTDREQESHTGPLRHDRALPHTRSPQRACSFQCSSAVQRGTCPHTLCHTHALTQTCSISNALPLDTLQQKKGILISNPTHSGIIAAWTTHTQLTVQYFNPNPKGVDCSEGGVKVLTTVRSCTHSASVTGAFTLMSSILPVLHYIATRTLHSRATRR